MYIIAYVNGGVNLFRDRSGGRNQAGEAVVAVCAEVAFDLFDGAEDGGEF